jgi:hypothetical protein
MKRLELNQLEMIEGGDWGRDVDIACAVYSSYTLFGPAALPASFFCAGWGVGRLAFK